MSPVLGLSDDPTARLPGQRARMIVRRLRLRTIVVLGAVAVVTTVAGRELGLHSDLFLGCEVGLLVTIFVVLHFVLPLVERHDRGASGEEHVGALLDSVLTAGFGVFHDADLGNGNVDHILVGPAGVFTIETKSRPGRVHIGRVHGATVNQARSQQARLERITGGPVEALIVYSEAWIDRPLARRRGVRVLPARMLLRYIETRPALLAPAEVESRLESIAEALRAQVREEQRQIRISAPFVRRD